VSAGWQYQIQGFELGPVPLSEMSRLILKGRITPATLVREGGGEWVRAETLAPLYPLPATTAEPWEMVLLGRFAVAGIPLGVALLPWGPVPRAAGSLVLAAFAVALVRLLVGMARDVTAIRSKLGEDRTG
jgi:hypothetical protein